MTTPNGTEQPYTVGQTAAQGMREIIAIESDKVCVADHTAGPIKNAASRQWYKLTSPKLARIFRV